MRRENSPSSADEGSFDTILTLWTYVVVFSRILSMQVSHAGPN
jgi:hypothetical protein